jgi:curved DNA-binding protein
MEYRDYYKILGVPKTATTKEIKSAFRRLAREFHPDVNKDNPNAEARFKEINEANEVLSDPEKRKKYDELGANWHLYEQWQRSGGQGSPFGFGGPGTGGRGGSRTLTEEELRNLFGGAAGFGGGEAGGFSDFFRTFFDMGAPPRGQARRAPRPRAMAGEDLEHELHISLEEAYHGTTRIIQVSNPDGTTRRLEIKVPPGVGDGQGIRYGGQGYTGHLGGPDGDLVVRVRVRPHDQITRDGDDLSMRASVPLTTAMLGGELVVPTLAGPRGLRIPPETRDGRRFRLTGQGMPRFKRPGERGDLYVEVHVDLPRDLTARERELFEELARLEAQKQSSAAD